MLHTKMYKSRMAIMVKQLMLVGAERRVHILLCIRKCDVEVSGRNGRENTCHDWTREYYNV